MLAAANIPAVRLCSILGAKRGTTVRIDISQTLFRISRAVVDLTDHQIALPGGNLMDAREAGYTPIFPIKQALRRDMPDDLAEHLPYVAILISAKSLPPIYCKLRFLPERGSVLVNLYTHDMRGTWYTRRWSCSPSRHYEYVVPWQKAPEETGKIKWLVRAEIQRRTFYANTIRKIDEEVKNK